jgi:hypothetical protein
VSLWECVLTSRDDAGNYKWRRIDAAEPRGQLNSEMVPPGADIGTHVFVKATQSIDGLVINECRLVTPIKDKAPSDQNATTENQSPIGEMVCGALYWSVVFNINENPDSEGKKRPAVLVSTTGSHWRVMGLTTKSHYLDNDARQPIPDFKAVGLKSKGYLWGHKLTSITSESIHEFIGYADEQLVEEIVSLATRDLTENEIDDLRTSARARARASQRMNRERNSSETGPGKTKFLLTPESIQRFLEESNEQIKGDLESYFLSGNYTGRHFESYSQMSNPCMFDGNDIAAVMCLSIKPDANIASDIYELATAKEPLFSPTERNKPMWERPLSDYSPEGLFSTTYFALKAIPNIGPTIASKLMASKFPHAIPIWDRDVSALLNNPEAWWQGWYDVMQSSKVRGQLSKLRTHIGHEGLSLLRVADVALWMEAQRNK